MKNSKNILSRDVITDLDGNPYLCASMDNNAVSDYVKYNEDYLDEGNCIFIGGKTFVVTYQEENFYSNDSHNLILHLKNTEKRSMPVYLFLCAIIRKGLLHKYSWDNSISRRKIQKDKILIPVRADGEICFDVMVKFIIAMKKLVIKDIVTWVDKKSGMPRSIFGEKPAGKVLLPTDEHLANG